MGNALRKLNNEFPGQLRLAHLFLAQAVINIKLKQVAKGAPKLLPDNKKEKNFFGRVQSNPVPNRLV